MIQSNKTLILIISLLAIVFAGFEFGRQADFYTYVSAAEQLKYRPNIYEILHGDPALFFYYGSPFYTWLLKIFTLVPFPIAALVFKLLNLLLLARSWKLIEGYFPNNFKTHSSYPFWIALSFIGVAFPLYENFHTIQHTILLLYVLIESMHQVKDNNRPFLGAAILALGIFIKISPLVLLPYWLYRRHFKAAFLVPLFLLAFFILPSIYLGWDFNMELWNSWINQLIPDVKGEVFDMNNRKNHGLESWLFSLLSEGIKNSHSLSWKRNILDLNPLTVKWIILAFRSLLVLFFLYFLRTNPFKEAKNKFHQIWELSYLLLVIPLIFPQQRIYNFVLLLPAVAYCLYFLLNKKIPKKFWRVLLIVALVLLNLELFLGTFRKILWHYKTITYATLILGIILARFAPTELVKSESLNSK